MYVRSEIHFSRRAKVFITWIFVGRLAHLKERQA